MSDPRALEAAFRRILATRMADMPLRNPAIDVEAVGFREWDGRQAGVLVTPWSIGLVILPGTAADVHALALDERRSWRFPSGEYEFMGGEEPECGPFHFCSLFSPPDEIPDHAQARAIAAAVMEQLFEGSGWLVEHERAATISRRALFTGSRPAEAPQVSPQSRANAPVEAADRA
jgi:[NiFe] hydrogenase assembly HybE family chaperone